MEYVLGPGAYQWRGDCLVRLDERYRQSVVFIGTSDRASDGGITPWGTGFIVGDIETKSYYVVTAWHVIEDKIDAPFDIRFNKIETGAGIYSIEYPEWITHESDNTVDVAVHEINVPEWAELYFVPMNQGILATERIESKNIGAGSRTYTVGLWKFLHGDQRNQPFVYSGHIGLMPKDQRIPVNSWLPPPRQLKDRVLVDAFLVEGEPLDGASGSPVFVRRTFSTWVVPKDTKTGKTNEATVEGSVWCLGLLSDVFTTQPGIDYDPRMKGLIPRGVNVVVPSVKIREVLDHPKLTAARAAKREDAIAARMPMKASSRATTDENPSHKEDFNRLLNEAARGKPKGDQT